MLVFLISNVALGLPFDKHSTILKLGQCFSFVKLWMYVIYYRLESKAAYGNKFLFKNPQKMIKISVDTILGLIKFNSIRVKLEIEDHMGRTERRSNGFTWPRLLFLVSLRISLTFVRLLPNKKHMYSENFMRDPSSISCERALTH